jgi:hypothetical protein
MVPGESRTSPTPPTTSAWQRGSGGVLFGRFALDPTVRIVPSHRDRGKVANQAWLGYNVMASLAAMALGRTAGRLTEISDANLRRRARR